MFTVVLFLIGCSSTKVKTYNDPNLESTKLNSIALLPLRNSFVQQNASLSIGEILEVNKMFQQEFILKNPGIKVLNSVESTEMLNEKSLVEDYDKLLSIYSNTGIPNTDILKDIGKSLGIDAIAQGFLVKVHQVDGQYGVVNAETTIVVKYVMFSTRTGNILWEVVANGSKKKSTVGNAPDVEEVLKVLRKKITSSVPKLRS